MQLPLKILYICTHNRCRSILSEAVTNKLAAGRLEARSAGSSPVDQVHPLSIQYLQELGYSTQGLQSQSWDDFEDWAPDVIITVCDAAAAEACPLWMGQGLKLHWGLADPSKLAGDESVIADAFRDTIHQIEARVQAITALPLETLSSTALAQALRELTGAG